MEIVNAHVHMIDLAGMLDKYGNVAVSGGISVFRDLERTLPLLLPENLVAQMDDAGISKAVLYAVEAPIVYASNEYVHALCRRYPDRFIGFASVNPRDPWAADRLERAVTNLGLMGLKFHPPLQDFFPNDPAVYPLYEKAAMLNIPVVFHVGTTPFGGMCRLAQADPLLIDEVAVRFPDLRIMLTHLGTLWHNEAFMVAEKNPNVFIDTAAYLYEIKSLLTQDLLERIGPEKVIFGTDYPTPYGTYVHRMKDFVDCILGLGFPEETLGRIFSGNLQVLLTGDRKPRQDTDASEIMEKLKALTLSGSHRDKGSS